ncbi:unnamed protein product [Penicillium nalgiovense]|nr:unnamed protein product [Penicillium nalgiovense]
MAERSGIVVGLNAGRKTTALNTPRPASPAPRASLPAAPPSSAKSPRRSLVSLPTSAASLSCCATPRTSVPVSSLRSASVLSAAARPRLSPCRRLLLSLAALVLLTKFSDPFLFFFRFNDSTQKKRDSRIGKGVSWPLGVHEGEGKYGIPSLSYGVKP